ncbi:hypothetical protein FNH22_17590 [Fulvivirga sp. M361]|uniref:sensor histidine kinase n=1 Tax=Fulvivirga sp. M361 TaxID=2594266 RepID=UPI00117ADF5A|nr:histidine kinase [Fulvivirga sp. M361]TRX55976.1 hypothetical protein FNH22_17590 [Fulvivirga sp. M361]
MARNGKIVLNYTMRRFWVHLVTATFIGLIYYVYMYYSEKGVLPNTSSNYSYAVISVLTANFIGLVISFSDRKLDRLLPWGKYMAGRLLLGLITNSLISLTIIIGIGWLFLTSLDTKEELSTLYGKHTETILKLGIITFLAVLVYNIIYFALFSYRQYAVVQIGHVKTQRKQLQLQFEALKSQLSPHYLFNCLNTISSLIFKDTHLAEDFIRRLAETYQYILSNNHKQSVTLEEEVEFVKSYNYLLKVRFEDNLRIDINLPPNVMRSRIPPLTLQMLVENAVKHNVITRDQPLDIYIHAIDNTDIRITNTKTATPADISSFHVGLENIKKRYKHFTPKAIRIDDNSKFSVQLPVIREIARSA